MSRRRQSEPHRAYGMVRLVCPDGHALGETVKQPTGEYLITEPLVRIDGPNGETKIKARCGPCEASGTYRDLQASGTRLQPLLDELEDDPTRGMVEYVVGG